MTALGVASVSVPQPGEHGDTDTGGLPCVTCVSDQVTCLLDVFPTVEENCNVVFTCALGEPGETATVMAGTVMVAVPVCFVSATEVAVRVTVNVLAGGPGGV